MTGTSTVPESDAPQLDDPPRRRRRWLRITVWAVLAFFAIVFVYFAVTFYQVWRAREATAHVRRTRSWCSGRRSTTGSRPTF
ncbi:MAG: hypothetical protein M5U31_00210 [Acidimicrobiia bacterium]|nr:hypothetical protein [Acidimicrobiia bacterium]